MKKLKNEKGLTLIHTIILTILIIVLILGGYQVLRKMIGRQKEENLKTSTLMLQAKINKISNEYILNKKEENLVGIKLEDILENEKVKEFVDKKIINIEDKNKKYYVLQEDDIKKLELNDNNVFNDLYIVEYTEAKIYLLNGIKIDGEEYYELNEMENKEV